MRLFTDEQIVQLVHDAEDEQWRRVVLELRRLYEAEERRAQTDGLIYTMLSGVHQHLSAELRTVEGALRTMMPPPPAPTTPPEPPKKRPRVLMDEQPE